MARGELILRQWKLLATLQTRGEGIALRDLASEFSVSERTIQRDFEALQELGFPIEHDEDAYGKRLWRMPHNFFRTGPLVLSLTEAVSLHLAEHLIRPLAGTHFADGLQSVLDKIRSLVPRQALDHFAELDDIVYVRRTAQTDYASHAATIRTLIDAAQEDRTVTVTYRSLWRNESYATQFDPYGMVLYDGDLYLVGWSHRAEAVRNFKVTRIVSLEITQDRFDRPADFSLERPFQDSFGITHTGGPPVEIRVKFTGPAATLVEERVWHESQRLLWLTGEDLLFDPSPGDPEALLATFRLADVAEFKRWIRGFGEHAEILAPAWLRRELHDELLAAARRHSDWRIK